MLLLASVAFVFGWLASLAFSAAPFVAGNLLMVAGVAGIGLVQHWSWGWLAANLVVAVVALQGGYFFGIVRKVRRRTQARDHSQAASPVRRDAQP
jgi:hypothetical protein